MWHEARKQEKLIKGLIVDYRRRAERRRDFYEKIKADPTQFLQIHGRICKIHLDPAVAAAGESSAIMMPWQGDTENMIDRFDVRAHLDYIQNVSTPDVPLEDLGYEERNCNYERYRILAQNMFLGIAEEKFLHQLSVEEKYGVTLEEKEAQRDKQSEKKGVGVAIGFNYDSETQPPVPVTNTNTEDNKNESDEESDAEIIDVDLSIDVNKIEMSQAHAMNLCGVNFGMPGTDLFSFLTGDADEAEKSKQLMREEKEKALFSGRKSRRERRAHRDKKLALRIVSPPHYAARAPSPRPLSPSPARSPSPSALGHPHTDKITFITSFGGEEDQQNVSPERSALNKQKTYASALKDGRKRLRTPSPRKVRKSPVKRSKTRYSPSRRSVSRSRSRSVSSNYSKSRSRSNRRSHTRSRSKLRSRSQSSSRSYSRRRSRSSSYSSRGRLRRRSRSTSSTSSRSSYSRDDRRKYNSSSKYSNNNNSQHGGNSVSQIPKYYGRKRDGARSSSSELSLDSESDNDSETINSSRDKMIGGKSSHVSNVVHNSGATSKQTREKVTAKERLKRKMQAQLSRQLRADMKAEAERQEREQMMQQERDDEMRELAIKIRRRQRELRHQRYSQSSNDGSSSPHLSRKSPRPCSRDRSSENEAPKQGEKTQDRRSQERYLPSRSSKTKTSFREYDDAPIEGHSSKHHNPSGLSDWKGDSRTGRNPPDLRGNNRDGNQDNRSHFGNAYQSRPYNKYSYKREDEGRSGANERSRDQDYGKSGRHWNARKDYEDSGHRNHSERGGKHSEASKYRRREDNSVIKYSDKKLVDY